MLWIVVPGSAQATVDGVFQCNATRCSKHRPPRASHTFVGASRFEAKSESEDLQVGQMDCTGPDGLGVWVIHVNVTGVEAF